MLRLVLAALLIFLSPNSAWLQETELHSYDTAMTTTAPVPHRVECRCCIVEPDGHCCSDSCAIAMDLLPFTTGSSSEALRGHQPPYSPWVISPKWISKSLLQVTAPLSGSFNKASALKTIPFVGPSSIATPPPSKQVPVESAIAGCQFQKTLKLDLERDHVAVASFMALPAVKACDAVIPQFTKITRDTIKAYTRLHWDLKDYVGICQQYADTCLSSASLSFAPEFSLQDRIEVSSHLVLLVSDNGRSYCHGFRIGAYIITAAHCLEGSSEGEVVAVRSLNTSKTSMYSPVAVGNVAGNSFGYQDYALLRSKDPNSVTTAKDVSWLGRPQMSKRLLITQLNVYKSIAFGFDVSDDLSPLTAFEDNPLCNASGVSDDGFILNGCQSAEGTSGTPYIQKDSNGDLHIVGIHSGETSGLAESSLSQCSISLPNYGVTIPKIIFDKLLAD